MLEIDAQPNIQIKTQNSYHKKLMDFTVAKFRQKEKNEKNESYKQIELDKKYGCFCINESGFEHWYIGTK